MATAMETVSQDAIIEVMRRRFPIQNGVTIWVFKPRSKLDGVRSVIERWAGQHGYPRVDVADSSTEFFGRRFYALGVTISTDRSVPATPQPSAAGGGTGQTTTAPQLPPPAALLDPAYVDCAAGMLCDRVSELYTGETDVTEAALVLVIGHGKGIAQTARSIGEAVTKQLKTCSTHARIRSGDEERLCGQRSTFIQFHTVTKSVS